MSSCQGYLVVPGRLYRAAKTPRQSDSGVWVGVKEMVTRTACLARFLVSEPLPCSSKV